MSKVVSKLSKALLLTLCLALLVTNSLILAPEVGAASDTNTKTETEINDYNNSDAEVDLLTSRAIAIDEAKKEAQAAVQEQLDIMAAQQAEEDAEDETQAESQQTESSEESSDYEEYTEASSSSDSGSGQTQTYVQAAAYTGYLMGIDNPDPNYVSYSVQLSDADRDLAERILMGEAGSMSYTGMALVAQSLRDAYVRGGYTSIAAVISAYGYYGSTSITPSATCKEVISYIFDQGGAAVQHRVMMFYASNICSSSWHESQNYICSDGYVRFFDSWT